jgi:hypothetical protein
MPDDELLNDDEGDEDGFAVVYCLAAEVAEA